MSTQVKYPVAIVAVFLWIGFVCAISFMEAWLKFRAPGVTLPIGLGIGRLVFSALNKVEWVFAVAILMSLVGSVRWFSPNAVLMYVPLGLLLLQTFWLLPALGMRAEMHIQGQPPASSGLHIYYVAAEVIKVSCLFIFGLKQFK